MARVRSVLVALVGLFSSAVACRQVVGIEPGLPIECVTEQDCAEKAPVCQVATACEQKVCVFEDVAEGTPTAEQTPGDCLQAVCDGAGKVKLVNEASANCVCGDGYVSTGEECDDKNTVGGDKCSATCQEEKVLQVVAGFGHTCARLTGGRVKCWGRNDFGQLGLEHTATRGDEPGEMGESLPFVNLGTGKTATTLASGEYHTCALLNDSSLKCWGRNDFGQLGLGDTYHRGDGPGEMGDNLPSVNLGMDKTAITIAAGGDHTCALLNDSSLKCWGYNSDGQLGLGDTAHRGDNPDEMGKSLPSVNLGTGKTVTAIAAGRWHTCALLNDSSLKCWGSNYAGQLGLGDVTYRGDNPNEMGDNLPSVNLGTGKTATAIVAGSPHTCALLNDSSLKCWGNNYAGQLGLGDTADRGDGPGEMGESLPTVDLGTGKTATALAAGDVHTCVLLNDSSLKCWGHNAAGQLGLGDLADRGDNPDEMGERLNSVNLGTGKTITAIATGFYHTCALLNDSSLKCWGNNYAGQLGLGDTVHRGDNADELGDNLPTVKLYSDTW